MADIYSSAYVVLAASAAEDCAQGFLSRRNSLFIMQQAKHNGEAFEVHARHNDGHSCDLDGINYEQPLYRRGWCMQKRLVARRIVHIMPDDTSFECRMSQL
jgi:hypothetical protein